MRVLISISKEFEQHFKQDAFEDSLHRLSADAHLLAGNYEQETAVMLIEAFKNAVPVPPQGRLGDLDELEKTFREDADAEWNRFACPVNWADAFDDVADMIADAPTIIPAEEGE